MVVGNNILGYDQRKQDCKIKWVTTCLILNSLVMDVVLFGYLGMSQDLDLLHFKRVLISRAWRLHILESLLIWIDLHVLLKKKKKTEKQKPFLSVLFICWFLKGNTWLVNADINSRYPYGCGLVSGPLGTLLLWLFHPIHTSSRIQLIYTYIFLIFLNQLRYSILYEFSIQGTFLVI